MIFLQGKDSACQPYYVSRSASSIHVFQNESEDFNYLYCYFSFARADV